MRSMIWLRVHDNPALFHACQHGLDGVLAVYMIDDSLWQRNDTSDRQVAFILRGLKVLSDELQTLGIAFRIERVGKTEEIPALLDALAQQYKITSVFWNREDEQMNLNGTERYRIYCNDTTFPVKFFVINCLLGLQQV